MALKIAVVGAQTLEPECTHWKGIEIGMKELGIEYYPIDYRALGRDQVLEQINSIDNLDLLIWGLIDPFEYPGLIRVAKAKKRAFWFAELRDERTGGYLKHDMRDQVDFGLTSAAGVIPLYERKTKVPWYFMPQAGFEGELIDSPYRDLDVAFIGGKVEGGLHGKRLAMIKEISFPIEHINKEDLWERMEIYAQMPTIYSTAKICFDASQVWDVEKYCSARYFHIAANGGFSICRRFPGCEELFPEGVGKVYFDTPEEATALLECFTRPTYAQHRKQIAAAGKEHALAYHTYTNRIDDICKIL